MRFERGPRREPMNQLRKDFFAGSGISLIFVVIFVFLAAGCADEKEGRSSHRRPQETQSGKSIPPSSDPGPLEKSKEPSRVVKLLKIFAPELSESRDQDLQFAEEIESISLNFSEAKSSNCEGCRDIEVSLLFKEPKKEGEFVSSPVVFTKRNINVSELSLSGKKLIPLESEVSAQSSDSKDTLSAAVVCVLGCRRVGVLVSLGATQDGEKIKAQAITGFIFLQDRDSSNRKVKGQKREAPVGSLRLFASINPEVKD